MNVVGLAFVWECARGDVALAAKAALEMPDSERRWRQLGRAWRHALQLDDKLSLAERRMRKL